MSNPIRRLNELGQAVWLDFLSRPLLTQGGLQRLMDEDGISGVTSNPAIFDKAISKGTDYEKALRRAFEQFSEPEEVFHHIALEDIATAADLLQPVFASSGGRDGFVSFEVSPRLAHDTEGSVRRAREVWDTINRPNVFIKIPATVEGLPAIRELISLGINVNVTLLFSLARYREVAEAFVAGMEERLEAGHAVDRISSVASFFLSRIDTEVDRRIDRIAEDGGIKGAGAQALRGKVAIASAKQAFVAWREIFEGDRFERLRKLEIRPQRLLWASTGTKDAAYSDVKYIEPLIGPDTINTMPMKTIDAYRDHGDPQPRLADDLIESGATLIALEEAGIDLESITNQLEKEGVEKFSRPYDHLLESIEKKMEKAGT